MAKTEQLEHVREYGFFDGLYFRDAEGTELRTKAEVDAYREGWDAGSRERRRWNEFKPQPTVVDVSRVLAKVTVGVEEQMRANLSAIKAEVARKMGLPAAEFEGWREL